MRKRGRRKQALLFSTAALILLSLLAWFFAVFRREIRIMPPEPVEKTAMRKSREENAYYVLERVMGSDVPVPKPLLVQNPRVRKLKNPYVPKWDSMGRLLSIERPDDDPELIQYVEAHDPQIEMAREALARPYYLLPEIGVSRDAYLPLYYPLSCLGRVLTARAVLRAHTHAADAKAFAYLFDAVRLGHMVAGDGSAHGYWEGCDMQQLALLYVDELVRCHPTDEMLEEVGGQLAALATGVRSPRANLEFMWRQLDNSRTTAALFDEDYVQETSLLEKALDSCAVRRLRRFLANHRDELLEVSEYDLLRFRACRWSEDNECSVRDDMEPWHPIRYLRYAVNHRSELEACFRGAQLVVALEQHRRAYGAHPESLDALSADLPEGCRMDPCRNAPFVYRIEEDDYVLYSVGENGRDDSEKGEGVRVSWDIAIHEPAETQE